MKITILGCGNAFSTVNGNNCILLEENDSRLLIDAGWDLPHMLKRNNVDVKSIDYIYISHAHADHCGGLEYMAFSRYDWMRKPGIASDTSPYLIANSTFMNELWEYSLKGGLRSIEGRDATLATFFKLLPIQPNETFLWEGWEFQLIQQIHIMTGSIISPTFGLIATKPCHKTIYFVTDSQHCSPRQQELFYKQSDLIFQDCEITPFYSNVHANYEQLAGYDNANAIKLSPEIKAKMWLTHYQDFLNSKKDFYGNECDWDAKAAADGFAGFVRVGQQFEV